jgi:hypothetical protein
MALAIALGVSATASAQDAGKFWMGGSIGLTTTYHQSRGSASNYKFLPEIGYMVNDKIGVGVYAGFLRQEIDLEGLVITSTVESTVFSAFIRSTLLKGNIGGIFVDGGIEYAQATGKNVNENEATITGLAIGVRPGVALNVSKNIQLTTRFGLFGYQTFDIKSMGDKNKLEVVNVDLDLSETLFGINFVF